MPRFDCILFFGVLKKISCIVITYIYLYQLIIIAMDPNQSPTLEAILSELCTSELKITPQQLTSLTKQPLINRSLGCLMGSFIGDALGSFCQFEGAQSENRMKVCMAMPGGGPFMLKAGQVTDDSEMAVHMLEGLGNYQPDVKLGEQIDYLQFCIGQQYVSWLASNPFDIGNTCHSAIVNLKQNLPKNGQSFPQFKQNQQQNLKNLNKAVKQIEQSSQQSLSNGFLMRITPMACFHALLSQSGQNQLELKQLVQKQSKLTHSHPLVLDSAVEWVQMLSKIIRTETPAASTNKQSQLAQLAHYNKIFQQFITKTNDYIQPSIKTQILQSIKNKQPIPATTSIGYFKHAYHFAIYEMQGIECTERLYREEELKHKNEGSTTNAPKINRELNGDYFKQSLKFVIKQGGDTDTNACIIGGLMGALIGFDQLPSEYLVKQLSLRLKTNSRYGHARLYEPRTGFCNMIRLARKILKVV